MSIELFKASNRHSNEMSESYKFLMSRFPNKLTIPGTSTQKNILENTINNQINIALVQRRTNVNPMARSIYEKHVESQSDDEIFQLSCDNFDIPNFSNPGSIESPQAEEA